MIRDSCFVRRYRSLALPALMLVSAIRNPHSTFLPRSPFIILHSSFIIPSRPSVCAEFGFVWRYTFPHAPQSSFIILHSSFIIPSWPSICAAGGFVWPLRFPTIASSLFPFPFSPFPCSGVSAHSAFPLPFSLFPYSYFIIRNSHAPGAHTRRASVPTLFTCRALYGARRARRSVCRK